MAFETACQFRDMKTSGRALIDMCVAVVSAGGRLEHPKYGVVESDHFDEALPVTSWVWRGRPFPSVKLRIEKAGHHNGRNPGRHHVGQHLPDELRHQLQQKTPQFPNSPRFETTISYGRSQFKRPFEAR